jgi:hypothetical protein
MPRTPAPKRFTTRDEWEMLVRRLSRLRQVSCPPPWLSDTIAAIESRKRQLSAYGWRIVSRDGQVWHFAGPGDQRLHVPSATSAGAARALLRQLSGAVMVMSKEISSMPQNDEFDEVGDLDKLPEIARYRELIAPRGGSDAIARSRR